MLYPLSYGGVPAMRVAGAEGSRGLFGTRSCLSQR